MQRKKKGPYRQRLHSLIMAAGIEHFGSYTYKFFLTPFGSGHLLRVCCSCVLTYPSTTPDFFLRRNLRTGCHSCETTALLCAPVASIGDTLCKILLSPCYKAAHEPSSSPAPSFFFFVVVSFCAYASSFTLKLPYLSSDNETEGGHLSSLRVTNYPALLKLYRRETQLSLAHSFSSERWEAKQILNAGVSGIKVRNTHENTLRRIYMQRNAIIL